MTAPQRESHFGRLIEVLRPEGIWLMLEGYFDESGSFEESPGIFCLAGYFITTDAARLMDAEWLDVISDYKIPFFHMVDCAPGNDFFSEIAEEDRIELVKRLIALIKKYTLEGFAIFAKADSYEQPPGSPDVYSYCAEACAQAMQIFMKMQRVDGSIAYFFETGHKNRGNAYNQIAQKIKRPIDTLTFAQKCQVRILQAADILAWQATKYAKDWLYPRMEGIAPKRQPRKDFQSLMEHSHSFMHIDISGGKKRTGIELWPLSKRTQHTVAMSVNDSGPIVYLQEDGDKMPIIPIEKTVGYRPAPAKMAYVAFEDMKQQRFALSFDEPRLYEALASLMDATALYADSKIIPIFSAESIVVDGTPDTTVLRIKVREGATIAFHLPTDVVERLREALKK